MGVRVTSNIISDNGAEYAVYIYDSLFSGTPLVVDVAGFELSYNGSGDERDEAIKGSDCKLNIMVQTADDLTLLSDIANAQEERFTIYITKPDGVFWFGHILNDLIDYEDIYYPSQTTLTATDGLARLKDIDYDNAGVLYTGRETILKHIYNILLKLNLTQFLSGDEPFIKTSVNWYESQHPTPSATTDTLLLTDVSHEAFYKEKQIEGETVKIATNCYDVLKELLRRFFCKIYFENGAFHIYQIPNLITTSYYVHEYDTTLTILQHTTQNPTQEIEFININKISGSNYNFFPPLRKVTLTYNHKTSTQNILVSNVFYPVQDLGVITGGVGSGNKLEFTGIVNQIYTGDAITINIVRGKYELFLQVGNYYAYGTNKIQGWTLTPSVITYIGWESGGEGIDETNMPIAFTTPEIPATGNGYFSFRRVAILKVNGSTPATLPLPSGHTFESFYKEFYLYFVLNDKIEEKRQFEYVNTTNGTDPVTSRFIMELDDILIGDGPAGVTVGRMKAWTGSAWVDTQTWGVGVKGGEDINFLLLKEFLGGQKTATRKIDAEVVGSVGYTTRILYDNSLWMCNGVTLNSDNDTWSGEWVEIVKNVINLLPSNLIYITKLERPSYIYLDGFSKTTLQSSIQEYNSNLSRSSTAIKEPFVSGLRTQIPINEINIATFQAGDRITLYNINNNAEYELVVSADQLSDADYIDIVEYDFPDAVPEGSIVSFSGKRIAKMIKGQMSIDGDMEGIRLVNDEETPGESQYYGTDTNGIRGYYDLSDESVIINNDGLVEHFTNLRGLLGHIGNPCFLDGLNITDNLDGTIDVSEGEVYIKTSNSLDAPLKLVKVPARYNIPVTENVVNTLYVDYNSGSPSIEIKTATVGYFDTNWDKIPMAVISRYGTTIALTPFKDVGTNAIYKSILAQANLEQVRYLYGLQISEPAPLKLAMTGGRTYIIYDPRDVAPINTNTGDTVTLCYKTPVEWNRNHSATTLDTNFYNDIDIGLVPLSNNKYATYDIYLLVDNPDRYYVVYPQAEYIQLEQAQRAPVPTVLPPEIGLFSTSKHIGRVIVKEGGAVFVDILSALDSSFTSTYPTLHDNLSGINDYWQHLTPDGITTDTPTNIAGLLKGSGGKVAAASPGVDYLVSEADTLGTVTGRGATTATESTFSGGLVLGKFRPSADNTTAIQIMKANGTTPVVTVDTTNNRLLLGTTSSYFSLNVSNGIFLDTGAVSVNSYGKLIERYNSGVKITSDYPTNASLGLYAQTHIAFVTSISQERMRILDTGNIGVNMTSPVSRFHMDFGNATAGELKLTNGTTTGITATDGFGLKLDTSGNAYLWQYENLPLYIGTNNSTKITVLGNGNIAAGNFTPTARIHLPAGTAAAGTAPLKTELGGVLLTTPEPGAVEATDSHIYWTDSKGNRIPLNQQPEQVSFYPSVIMDKTFKNNDSWLYNQASFTIVDINFTTFVLTVDRAVYLPRLEDNKTISLVSTWQVHKKTVDINGQGLAAALQLTAQTSLTTFTFALQTGQVLATLQAVFTNDSLISFRCPANFVIPLKNTPAIVPNAAWIALDSLVNHFIQFVCKSQGKYRALIYCNNGSAEKGFGYSESTDFITWTDAVKVVPSAGELSAAGWLSTTANLAFPQSTNIYENSKWYIPFRSIKLGTAVRRIGRIEYNETLSSYLISTQYFTCTDLADDATVDWYSLSTFKFNNKYYAAGDIVVSGVRKIIVFTIPSADSFTLTKIQEITKSTNTQHWTYDVIGLPNLFSIKGQMFMVMQGGGNSYIHPNVGNVNGIYRWDAIQNKFVEYEMNPLGINEKLTTWLTWGYGHLGNQVVLEDGDIAYSLVGMNSTTNTYRIAAVKLNYQKESEIRKWQSYIK